MKTKYHCPINGSVGSCGILAKKKDKKLIVANSVYGDKQNRKFYHCPSCDIRYLFPRLSKKEEAKFYKKEFEKFMDSRSRSETNWLNTKKHIAQNKETFERRYKIIKSFLRPKSEILEIGCSSGFMMFPLIKKKFRCTGIEPSGVFNKFLKKKKINVHSSLEQLITKEPNKKFDIIMHFFVLEHIADPISFLKNLLSLLKKNGKIIFEIPNVADPLHTIYKNDAFEKFYWSIAHHWYFSDKSLRNLLKKLNKKFQIIYDQRYDLSNHIIWSRDKVPGGSKRFTKQLGKDLEENYKKNLIERKICDTLWGVIKK